VKYEIDIVFTDGVAAAVLWTPQPPDTASDRAELSSLNAKANAGFDGAGKLDGWPWSITRTSSMVGRSAGFSCTHRSPRWTHLSTSLSGAWQSSSDGSMASSGVPLDH
jgi:hypothetical protein